MGADPGGWELVSAKLLTSLSFWVTFPPSLETFQQQQQDCFRDCVAPPEMLCIYSQ